MSRYDPEQVMRDLAAMGNVERYRTLLGKPTLRERLYPRRFALASAATVVAGVAVFWFATPRPDAATRLATAVAEVREVVLADGSRVTLGAQSKLDYKFSAQARTVVLLGGEAFFSVVPDAARPFTVTSGDTKVTVLGTEFEIRRYRSEVSVAVVNGAVQVSRTASRIVPMMNAEPERHVLRSGQRLTLSVSDTVSSPQSVDTRAVGAWRDGRLVYDNVPLRDVVDDANRYFSGGIVIADSSLADIRVTTSFRTSQVEGMIDTLKAGLPIDAERNSDGGIVLKARRPASD